MIDTHILTKASGLWERWRLWLINRMARSHSNTSCSMNSSICLYLSTCLDWNITYVSPLCNMVIKSKWTILKFFSTRSSLGGNWCFFYTGWFTRRRPWINSYKPRNHLQMKTKLGNTVYFATLTRCLPARFATFLQSLLPCWLQVMRTWSVVSACVSRRSETNFDIFRNLIISTPTNILTKFRFH
jgi:hypothetical protein